RTPAAAGRRGGPRRDLRDFPRSRPRDRAPVGPERASLQHGLRGRDRVSACRRHRDRLRPPLVLGTDPAAHGRRRRGAGRSVLHMASGRVSRSVRGIPWAVSVAGLGLALWPSGAEAHLVTTGLGPVYDGLSHFAMTPEDLVPALALALLGGLRGAAHGRRAVLVLPVAWLLGGLLGLAGQGVVSPALTAISFVILGGLVAADARLPLGATTLLAASL